MRTRCLILLILLLLLLGGCTRAPQPLAAPPSPPTAGPPAFVRLPAEQAIPQVIAVERDASIRGDLALLAQLWAEDARIVDTRGTDDASDDFTWSGRAAVLDRYHLAVFPAPPPPLEELPTPAITVQGDQAQAVNGQDRWHFTRQAGRWWIAELAY